MSGKRGFTLVEMIVVVAIVALMLTFGIPAFSKWKARHDVEAQAAKLFGDLEFVRMKAYSEKIPHRIFWGTALNTPFTNYAIQSDGDLDGTYAEAGDTNLSITSRFSVTPTLANGISCDGRGFCTPGSLYITSSTGAVTDCAVVARTRIKIGRWNGAACIPR